jgi:hypothetical protein
MYLHWKEWKPVGTKGIDTKEAFPEKVSTRFLIPSIS